MAHSKEIERILSERIYALAAALGNNQECYTEPIRKLEIWDDKYLALYEFLESSQLQKNLVYSLWFDKEVQITVLTKDNRSYQLTGKLYRDLMAGYVFEEEYNKAQQEFGEETDLAHIWLIEVTEVQETTYEAARKREKEEHPLLLHMDHLYREELAQ